MGERRAVKSWLVAFCLAVVGLVGAACGDPVRPTDRPVHYQFALAAFGGDTTAERVRNYDCVVYGFFDLPQPLPPNGTARFPVKVERRLFESRGSHNEMTRADTSITEAVLDYTGLGEDSLSFVLTAGPYTVSLGPGGVPVSEPYEYSGEWTCGPAVPLGHDSTLLAYGWDPGLQIAGTWRVSEILPIE